MGKQYRVVRKIASVPVSAGGFATIDIPRDYDYETLFLRVTGGLQVTAAATSVRTEAPCQVVQRAEVIADGKNNIFSAPFWFAALASYDRKLVEYNARCTTPPSGTAIATYNVEAIGTIDLMTCDSVRPKDTNFRSSGLTLFQLRMTFGQPGDAFVGGTVVFSNMFVDVFAQQLVEIADPAAVTKDNPDGLTSPIALKKTSYQEIALPSSNANQEIRLPAGNLIKSVVVRTEGAVTAGEPSTAILNNAMLTAGVDTRWNLSAANIRAKNNADIGQITAGYYVLDITQKGWAAINLTDLWDVTGTAEPKLVVDVTGGTNNKLQAVITEYIMGYGK
jgi:hypothetical protein